MKILDWYIIREFLKLLLFGLLALILVSTVVDLFERIDHIVENEPPLYISITYFLVRVPQLIFMTAPVAILLATLLTTGGFARNSEIIAMLANGVSIYRIMLPLLITGLIISLLLFGLNEFVVPPAKQIGEECKRIMKGQPDKRQVAKIQIWFRGDRENRIYYINALLPERREIHDLTIFELDEDFLPVKRVDAKRATYHVSDQEEHGVTSRSLLKTWFYDLFAPILPPAELHEVEDQLGTWILYQGTERTLENTDRQTVVRFEERRDYEIPRTFNEFRRETKAATAMNYRELRKYLQTLSASGYDVSKYIVDLRAKFSYPFVSFVMVIIGFPFALRSPRSGAAMGVGISVFIGLTYWIILQLGVSLGHAHILPPLVAAWISHIVFAATGFYLILNTHT